jgi:hypothetical protein
LISTALVFIVPRLDDEKRPSAAFPSSFVTATL